MKMIEVKCRGCEDKKLINASYEGAIGKMTELTGFAWLPLADGQSSWICRKCGKRLLELLKGVQDLVGDLYIYPPTAQDMLEKSFGKAKKVTKG